MRPLARSRSRMRAGGVQPGQVHDCGGEVHEAHRLRQPAARLGGRQVLPLLRKPHNERHTGAGIEQVALAAGQHAAVVAVVENDGIVRHAALLQLLDPPADLLIYLLNAVVVLRHVLPDFGQIGMIRRHVDFARIVPQIVVVLEQHALVGGAVVEHREERLPFLAVLVVGLPAGLVPGVLPRARDFFRIVIGLGIVGAVVSRGAHQQGEVFCKVGNVVAAPHMQRAQTAGVHTRDYRAPGRRTHRRVRESIFVKHALGGHLVQVWRGGHLIAVAPQPGAGILADHPQDVRTVFPLHAGLQSPREQQRPQSRATCLQKIPARKIVPGHNGLLAKWTSLNLNSIMPHVNCKVT